MVDDLAWRRMSPREKLKAIAAEQNAGGRDRLQEVLLEQRQRPGAANAVKWHQALAEQKGGHKLHVRRDDVPTPDRITAALNIMNLYGPEVDEACGVEEPTVDMWEARLIVPTRGQIHRLAMLTGFPWRFFYMPPPTPPRGACPYAERSATQGPARLRPRVRPAPGRCHRHVRRRALPLRRLQVPHRDVGRPGRKGRPPIQRGRQDARADMGSALTERDVSGP